MAPLSRVLSALWIVSTEVVDKWWAAIANKAANSICGLNIAVKREPRVSWPAVGWVVVVTGAGCGGAGCGGGGCGGAGAVLVTPTKCYHFFYN